jgi:Flp pilus assembly protein TadG
MFAIIRKFCRSLRCGTGGSAAIEFGIAAPLFVILVLGVIEAGYAAYQAMQVQNAVEAGALYAVKHGWDSARISAALVSATDTAGITATPSPTQFCGCPGVSGIISATCSSTCADGNSPGQYVQINAAITRRSLILSTNLPLPATFTAQSIVRLN